MTDIVSNGYLTDKNGNVMEIVDKAARDGVDRLTEEIEEIKSGTTIKQSGVLVALNCDVGADIAVSGEATEAVTLVHCGKNLLPQMPAAKTVGGVTITPNEDGTITLNGTYTGVSSTWPDIFPKETPLYLPAGTYTFSAKNATDDTLVAVQATDDSFSGNLSVGSTFPQKTASLENGAYVFAYITIKAGATYNNVIIYPQLEAGAESTAYEPHSKEVLSGVVLPTTLTARAGTNNIYTESGDVLTATTRKPVATIIDEAVDKKLAVDWSAFGLRVLTLDGDCTGMTKDDYVSMAFTFKDKDGNALSGNVDVKKQGASSVQTGVEIGAAFDTDLGGLFNFTIKFPEAFEAKEGWTAQKKYCFKANAIDHSHARNVCSCKLWGEIVKSRANVPTELSSLVNGGAIDGFPIIIVLNGKYYALGTFNIPKDGWMFGSPKAILCADAHSDATKFKALATLDGDFELEYVEDEDNSDWVLTSINTAIQAVMDSDGSDLETTIGQYIDIPSAIDYFIHTVDENADDGLDKNYILVTFDGVKWYFSAYDRDTVYGLYWNGTTFTSPISHVTFAGYASTHKLMGLIYNYKTADLKARAIELRDDIKSEINVCNVFTTFAATIPAEVLAQNCRRWPLLRSTNASNTAQILNWYRLRRQIIDKEIDSM